MYQLLQSMEREFGFIATIIMWYTRKAAWGKRQFILLISFLSRRLIDRPELKKKNIKDKCKNIQHQGFPSGHPPEY